MSNSWCIRLTWLYYDKVKCENYLKAMPSFGATHNTTQPHSHFYVVTEFDSKKLRNDLNRYKTTEKPPKGFKALSISELRTTTGQYYDYCTKKPESVEPYNNGIELSYPETSSTDGGQKKRVKTFIERIEEDIAISNADTMQQIGERVFYWYLERAKVLPARVILHQVIRTIVWRAEYRRKKEWTGTGVSPSQIEQICYNYVREALST